MSQDHIVVLIWLLVPSVMISIIAWQSYRKMRDTNKTPMDANRDAE